MEIHVSGNYAYVANRTSGFDILDIRDPQDPIHVGHLHTGGDAQSVDVAGHTAYLADCHKGLQIIDVSDPRHPAILATVATDDRAWSARERNGLVYVANTGDWLQAFSVADISRPEEVGRARISAAFAGLQIIGDSIYCADGMLGFHVIGIDSPARPLLRSTHRVDQRIKGAHVQGHSAFLATYSALWVIDIGDPSDPQMVGLLKTSYPTWDVTAHGTHAYLMDTGASIHVIDVSDPVNPREIGLFNPRHYPSKPMALSNAVASAQTPSRPSTSAEPGPGLGAITNAPPELSDPHRATDGTFSFILRGVPHGRYVVQASGTLGHWTTFSTNIVSGEGWTTVVDPEARHLTERFYRAVMQHPGTN